MPSLRDYDYELQRVLQGEVNPETGEIEFDTEKLEELLGNREEKIVKIACYIKDDRAMAKAIKEEVDSLNKRRERHEKTADYWQKYLEQYVGVGESFERPSVKIKWSKSTQTEVDEGFLKWAMRRGKRFLTYKDPVPNKTEIKSAIKAGEKFKFARLVEKQTMKIQ